MRRTALVAAAAAALLGLVATPAAADPNAYGQSGWVSTPQAARDLPAGFCAFPVHFGIPFDGVKSRVLETFPDGGVKLEEVNGPLIVEVTNLVTGASTNVNASSAAVIEFHQDGSFLIHWEGPILIGFRDGFNNNHRSGLFVLTGNFTALIAAAGRTILDGNGSERDVCAQLS